MLVAINKPPQKVARPDTLPVVFSDWSLVANKIGITTIETSEKMINNNVSV